ncbi:hypothetical protein T10_12051 [Trichinella papuae]|uniref:Uncharacterized protein n=1 Tax=Trichinella papuae TaxID=268474 RepID=A0A0V1LXH4_9BILA|nr:hypothetical protein T10_12051 [Trichinella papuae]
MRFDSQIVKKACISSDMTHSMSKVLHMHKVEVSGSAERELLMGNFPMY